VDWSILLRGVNKVTGLRRNLPQPAGSRRAYSGFMLRRPPAALLPDPPAPAADAWVPQRLPSFHATRPAESALQDWLQASRDALFRWTMAMATSADGRRAIAEMAVSIQRLRGPDAFGLWLYGSALQAAQHQSGGLPEGSLAGLPPELRALLRLVARRELRREEAMALLPQRMDFVRSRLLQARLASHSAPAPLEDWFSRLKKSV
jgi:hypothetical protein